MPENEEVVPTAAELHAEILKEQEEGKTDVDNDEGTPEPEKESGSDDDTADEDVIKGEEDDEGEGDEEDLAAKLSISPEDAEGLPPEKVKRFNERVKGIAKVEKRLKADESGLNNWLTVDAALSDRETAPKAAQELLKIVTKNTGLTAQELLGIQATTQDGNSESKYGFEFASEDAIYEKALADAEAAMVKKFGLDPDLISELKTEREQKKQEKADKEWFDSKGTTVIAKVEKQKGWKVTEDMVLTARRKNPDLFKQDAFSALKREFTDEYIQSQVKSTKKTPPDIVESATSKGIHIPDDPLEYSAAHALLEEAG